MGKIAQVEPNSGDMLAMVARSASGRPLQAVAEEFDEFVDHALLAQYLGDGEHQIGGRGAGRQRAGELEADHLRNQHGDRLAQHGGFGFDAADAPAQHAQTIDHGGVRIRADQGVRIGALFLPVASSEKITRASRSMLT